MKTVCPDLVADNKLLSDSDKDGIQDLLDLCPTRAETYNGVFDLDGCPDSSMTERDSDMDGIIDAFDECPLDPEIFNMFFDF